jgi:hypothetical protein
MAFLKPTSRRQTWGWNRPSGVRGAEMQVRMGPRGQAAEQDWSRCGGAEWVESAAFCRGMGDYPVGMRHPTGARENCLGRWYQQQVSPTTPIGCSVDLGLHILVSPRPLYGVTGEYIQDAACQVRLW